MSVITLDAETFYRSKKDRTTPGPRYSLSGSTGKTYEMYIRDPEFKVHGMGVQIDRARPIWITEHIGERLAEIFTPGNDHTVVCHNALFDLAILCWHYRLRAETYYCTQAMSRAIWQSSRHSLDQLVKRCVKGLRKGHELQDLDGVYNPTPKQLAVLGKYCVNDIDCTFESFAYMHQFFPAEELEVVNLTLQMAVHPGFILDAPRVQAHSLNLKKTYQRALLAADVDEDKLTSNPKFAKLLESKGIQPPRKASPTPKNPNNTSWAFAQDDLAYQKIQTDHPELQPLWKARQLANATGDAARCVRLLDHAAVGPTNPEGRIALPLNYAAAHTTRWGGTNRVNAQSFKRGGELRKSLLAEPGHQIVVADLSNIESRVLAWLADCQLILQTFREKRDLYGEFASLIYDRHIDRKNPARNEAGQMIDEDGNVVQRKSDAFKPDWLEGFVGKVAILALGFGQGHDAFTKTLAKGALGGPPVIITNAQGYRIVRKLYRGTYKEIPDLWKKLDTLLRHMANPTLKPFVFEDCIGVEPYRLRMPNGLYLNYPGLKSVQNDDEGGFHFEYWNGRYWKDIYGGALAENICQCLARIVMSTQMLAIDKALKARYQGRVILTVHDEVIATVPTPHAEDALQLMLNTMRIAPSWCNTRGLVLDAEGGYAQNYSK